MKKKISISRKNRADLSTTGAKHHPPLFLLPCWVFLAACTLTLLFAVNAQAQAPPNQQKGLFAEVDSHDYGYRDDTDAVIRSRAVQVDMTQLGGQQQLASQSNHAQPARTAPSPSSPYIQLNLFDDLVVQITHTRTYENDSGSLTWIGKIEGQPTSLAILIVRNSSIYGLVEVPNVGSFSIQPNAEGTHTIEQIRSDALLSGEDDFVIPDSTTSDATAGATPNVLMNNVAASAVEISNDDGSIIDVYVAYDQDASGGSVAAADAQSYAELFIAYTNQAYENSKINQRLWLVGTVDGYNYTDADSSSLSAELSDARSGIITGIHGKRNEYHADLVIFFAPYPGSSCNGLSYMQTTNNNVGWNTNGFSSMQACSFGQAIFAHELGHTMGSRHDWYVDSGTTPASIAHGYVDPMNNFRTIMSYGSRCEDLNISCSRIPNFSNPAVSYNGSATGVASGTNSSCSTGENPALECDADNTTNFNTKALITSQFRNSRVTWTGTVDTNWATAGNWSFNQGAPGATTVVNR
ncbi:MAG: hypothetical protein D3925_13630, partial [Candidatus Electrothrix sp. AR5]|nr:hypothetical protein [Candidatus Electrothrix sp. AR5]